MLETINERKQILRESDSRHAFVFVERRDQCEASGCKRATQFKAQTHPIATGAGAKTLDALSSNCAPAHDDTIVASRTFRT
jgi:hypothetical protein